MDAEGEHPNSNIQASKNLIKETGIRKTGLWTEVFSFIHRVIAGFKLFSKICGFHLLEELRFSRGVA